MASLRGGATAPSGSFPLLPLRNGVVFPGTRVTLPVGREKSVALLRTVHPGEIVGVVTQRDATLVDPGEDDVYGVGVFARVHHVGRVGDAEFRLVIEGLGRFELARLVEREPFWRAEGSLVEEPVRDEAEARALAEELVPIVRELAERGSFANVNCAAGGEPGVIADQIASSLGLSTEREMEVLATFDVVERLELVSQLLSEAKGAAEVKRKIDMTVRKEIGKTQREAVLREQLKAIKKELDDDDADVASALRARLEAAGLSPEAKAVADRELKRLEAMSAQSAEFNVIRNYLEWIADLPWSARADAKDDLDAVSEKLDADHHGLHDVKKRILEHMAVLKLSGNPRGSILCLVGPPGVGKTSLGQSIADATGRPFLRIALGGVRDEAEVRGHRRTYVGALPGRILHALRKAKVKNPIVLLDEIDKLMVGWSGSPESALLEVLDPEQNKTFTDHYLEIPFDLSEVVFVCTANTLETLSPPLRDRLEIIELSGYTLDEKLHIAKKHLIPKQLAEHAIETGALSISDPALSEIISAYTREAGVRQLNRQITKLCRALALEVARAKDGKAPRVRIERDNLESYLGRPRFFADVAERTEVAGVATGLAWTPVGGDILFIETSRMPGKGRLEITGQLGDVMKESARAALTYVRSNAERLGVDPHFLETQDIHVHVPAGGVPKDGPSAGVTIFTALTSLLTGRRVRSDTAMTGEVTLRGRVLPVGGIPSKILAAHRAGLTRVVLPKKNARDLDELPADVRGAMEFFFAEDMSQVLAAALEAEADPGSISAGASDAAVAVGATGSNDASAPSATTA
jgi:ATP-dependent Lon protease